MTQIPPPSFRIRNTKVSVRFSKDSEFFIMDPATLDFKTSAGYTYYCIKEYELGVVNDREVNPLRMIQKGRVGDYLVVDVKGDLTIIDADRARSLFRL